MIKQILYFLGILSLSFSFIKITEAQENLIPKPMKAFFGEEKLDLSNGVLINNGSSSLKNEYQMVEEVFKSWGVNKVKEVSKKRIPTVTLHLLPTFEGNDESYHLLINSHEINITAKTAKGIFYGIQTLRQFEIVDKKILFASIQDEPAFSWRAFLIDVGRNYQPISMIKEQIDIMAQYKLNILHFHFTEDIAWRLASKKYPRLTDSSMMTRWKGESYTEDEFRELIRYCQDRHILLFPEIDMPGHSKAFERYFGVNMQSDSGIVYIKELLHEFKKTYPELTKLHIGGDEVKITNKTFMPEITTYVESLGYTMTMGWDPGSNLMPQTVRQLWMGGPKIISAEDNKKYVDSKHLYINHMDPLETVTTLFHRKIGEQEKESLNLWGATLCSWPDRAVAKPIDMFYQNAVYPGILAFAERIWAGGGTANWTANIWPSQTKEYQDFVAFENRLLNHKYRFFKEKPFPYTKQSGLVWDLIGPFDNEGDLAKSFAIEQNAFLNEDVQIFKKVEGGTVILRHWWDSVVKGIIDSPQLNTTWYARTKIWSEQETIKDFWIGFDNLSRSYASDSPELHTWDSRQSKLWVNGQIIQPPKWKQAGQKGDLEKPLLDEGYSFREPTKIQMKKGWNEVLIKLPVKDFKGKDWQNPTKWMFTFIPLNEYISLNK